MNDYPTDAASHLQRAITLLLNGGTDCLLYAGLEIRLGTEVRQSQYASSWDYIPKKFQRSYKTTDVGKALERAFKTGDEVVHLSHRFSDGSPTIDLYYTPVSRELRSVCEQLGNYLHATKWQEAAAKNEEQWGARLRQLVITGIIHLHVATMGQLVGPAMTTTKDGKRQFNTRVLLPKDGGAYDALRNIGSNLILKVNHLPIEEFVAPLRKTFEDVNVLRNLAHPASSQLDTHPTSVS